jgi:pilus assembly protein CpaE
MAVRPVLLLTNELATVSAVASALESNGRLAADDVYRGLGELSARLASGPAPAVLVDIDEQPDRMLAALEPLARRHSETRFIVLSSGMSPELLLSAMQAGARHYLVKQSIASDLANVLHRLCPAGASAAKGGVVTVLSAGGGCGATTVAVNLAAELQLLANQTSLLIDLDSNYAGAAAYLGVDGQYGVADLLDRSGMLDAQLIRSTALAYSDQLHALIVGPKSRLGESMSLDPHRLREAVDACTSAYRWTVADAPRVSAAVASELAKASDLTLITMQLTVKDLRVAQVMLSRLAEAGVAGGTIRVLINRYHRRRSMITLEEGRQVLQKAEPGSIACLSNDHSAVSTAVNLGKPLAEVASRSDLRRELQKLAGELHQTAPALVQRRAG